MRTIEDIRQEYVGKVERHTQKEKQLEKRIGVLSEKCKALDEQIEQLREKKRKLWSKHPHWIGDALNPFIDEVLTHFDNLTADKSWPTFGLRCAHPVRFYDKDEWKAIRKMKDVREQDAAEAKAVKASLTFTPTKDDWFAFDTGEMKSGYPQGSIGDLNGFCNVTAKVESVEQIVEIIKAQIERRSEQL